MDSLRTKTKYIMGPDGSPLTIADLPLPGTRRWVIRRKAEVVAAVRGGLLSLEEACSRYTLSVDEFLVWHRSIRPPRFRGLAHAVGLVTVSAEVAHHIGAKNRGRAGRGCGFDYSDCDGRRI
jgi:hypothetical protein